VGFPGSTREEERIKKECRVLERKKGLESSESKLNDEKKKGLSELSFFPGTNKEKGTKKKVGERDSPWGSLAGGGEVYLRSNSQK